MNYALMFLLLLVQAAFAAQERPGLSYEDTPEFLTPQWETNTTTFKDGIAPKETWAYHFELVNSKGTKVLSKQNISVLLKPASTMKLFTGWWAFKKKGRTDTYLNFMLRRSDNDMADSTLQKLGGMLAMEDWYRELGLTMDADHFIGADGSGLSYDNKANCDIEIQLLRVIRKDASYNRYKNLLAQPKKDGTLKTRLTTLSGRVFAKTGTLNKTASLTGFVETPRGTMLFCVLSDYLNSSVSSARNKIDAMVRKNYTLANKK